MIISSLGEAKKVSERERVYTFPKGEKIHIHNVIELRVSDSGTHRIRTKFNGEVRLHIIPTGWLHIEIHEPEWTF